MKARWNSYINEEGNPRLVWQTNIADIYRFKWPRNTEPPFLIAITEDDGNHNIFYSGKNKYNISQELYNKLTSISEKDLLNFEKPMPL